MLDAWRDEAGALHLPITADPPAVSRLQAVKGTALVETDATIEQVAALARAVHLRCPIANMITSSGCELEVEWTGVPFSDDASGDAGDFADVGVGVGRD